MNPCEFTMSRAAIGFKLLGPNAGYQNYRNKIAVHVASRMIHQRVKERTAIEAFLIAPPAPMPPYHITVTRIGPRLLDPNENLPMSLKHVIDGICDALGIDDRESDPTTWEIAQEKGDYAVRVRIEGQ